MADNIEGTIVLDGLIEGRFTDGQATVEKLDGWVKFVKNATGLTFTADASGDSFSMLPDNQPATIDKLQPDPQDAIRQALEQLVQALPESDRPTVFSTLRSSEYRKNEEVQSLYAVQADGTVAFESRTVDAKTVASVAPLTTKEKVKMGAISATIVLVMFGILMLIPGVREKVGDVISGAKPIQEDQIRIQARQYSKWFTVEVKEANRKAAKLTLTATDAMPSSDGELQIAYDNAKSLSDKLAVEALARGYIRIELINDKGERYGSTELPLIALLSKVQMEKLKKKTGAAAPPKKQTDKPADKPADKQTDKAEDGETKKPKPVSVDVIIGISTNGKERIGLLLFRY